MLVAFGSDAPVAHPNPFLGIHAALTRQRPERMERPACILPSVSAWPRRSSPTRWAWPARRLGAHDRQHHALGKLADLVRDRP